MGECIYGIYVNQENWVYILHVKKNFNFCNVKEKSHNLHNKIMQNRFAKKRTRKKLKI